MTRSPLRLVALGAIAGLAHAMPGGDLFARATCSADNCYRAVKASAYPTRAGTQDCSTYLRSTVTPKTTTITATSTLTFTATVTDDVTSFTTADVTAVSTDTITVVSTPAPVTVTIPLGPVPPVKRQVTVTPSAIPTYASACSNYARYSSACSCIGVTGSDVTVAAPSTTTTVTVSITPATVIITSTVATDIIISTVATSVVPVTVSSVAPPPVVTAYGPFVLESSSGYDAGQFIDIAYSEGGLDFLGFTSDLSAAVQWIFVDGTLYAVTDGGEPATAGIAYDSYVVITSPDEDSQYDAATVVCDIQTNLQVTCAESGSSDASNYNLFEACGDELALYSTEEGSCGGNDSLTLEAVPV